MKRRDLLALSLLPALSACGRDARPMAEWLAARLGELPGGWIGETAARGHRLRQTPPAWSAVTGTPRRAQVLVLGAGVAGLACARRLRMAGVDVALLDLEDVAGGNSRAHEVVVGGGGAGRLPCPLGAHYLPVPGDGAQEVRELLASLDLMRYAMGRWTPDERWLCHSPQERLWWQDRWVEGLLPPPTTEAERAQYERFGVRVEVLRREVGFQMPSVNQRWTAAHQALDALTFAQWLNDEGFTAAPLRWYLDYCCRDDYGTDSHGVSAWAGLHYFGSRHGFLSSDERDAVFTWPQGNGFLTQALAVPLADAFHGGRTVLRVREDRHAVQVLAWNEATQTPERWEASQVVLAAPLFIAARWLEQPPDALVAAARGMRYAPWLVTQLLLDRPPLERVGAGLAWDNVVYGSEALGYVNADHQSLSPVAGRMVWTAYRALPASARGALLKDDWRVWAGRVLADLAPLHADLPERLERMELMRYGHAMSIPLPGLRSSAALAAVRDSGFGRLHVAHADVAGYSVFEEAFTQGERVARRLSGR